MMESAFLTEVYVYSLGAIFLYLVIRGVDNIWYGKFEAVTTLATSLVLALMFLTKQSAIIWILFSYLMAFIFVSAHGWLKIGNLKHLSWSAIYPLIPSIAGRWIYNFMIPRNCAAVRDKNPFNYQFVNILELKNQLFLKKLVESVSFYARILFIEFNWLWMIPLSLLLFYVLTRRLKANRTLWTSLILAWLLSFLPVAIFIRDHCVRYYAIGFLFLFFLLAYLLTVLYEHSRLGKIAVRGFFISLLVFKVFASYQLILKYKANDMCLAETPVAWANGIGMPEMLEKISKFEAGIAFLDPQWGLPSTAVMIFYKRYPQVVFTSIKQNVFQCKSAADLLAHFAPMLKGQHVYFIFDTHTNGSRQWVSALLSNQKLCSRRQIIEKKFGNMILEDSSVVLCEAV